MKDTSSRPKLQLTVEQLEQRTDDMHQLRSSVESLAPEMERFAPKVGSPLQNCHGVPMLLKMMGDDHVCRLTSPH